MADEEVIEEGGAEEEGKKKRGGLMGLLPKVLKWVALIIGATIFIVTVVVVTVNIMGTGTSELQVVASDPLIYQGTPQEYDWFEVEEIRTRTVDLPPSTVVIKLHLGYVKGDQEVQVELINRTIEIYDQVRSFFSSRSKDELNPSMEDGVKQELKERLNRIMAAGKIQSIAFQDFNVYDY